MSAEEEVIEVTIDMAELKKMKVPELKKKVAELGLPTKGTKAELLARVEKYIHEQEEELLVEEEEVEEEEGEEEGEEEQGEEEGAEEVEEEEEEEEEAGEETAAGPPQQLTEKPTPEAGNGQVKSDSEQAVQAVSLEPKISTKVSTNQADRLTQRAARFGGNSSEEAKKVARAERFGTALENGYLGLGKRAQLSEEELEKMKKRAGRFGSSVSPAITGLEDVEKKKKRLERFGQSVTDLSVEERKKARAARFDS